VKENSTLAQINKALRAFGPLLQPQEAQEPILARPVRNALLEWLQETWAADELAAVELKPRRRAIFHGAPGVGKTTLGHHFAARLGLPLLIVRSDRVINKYIGATGENVGRLFDVAAAAGEEGQPIVILIDEFDAVARQRRAAEQASDDERNAIVDALLQRIEQHDGYLIATTNFGAEIDTAVWRRFDIHIRLDPPGQFEREHILARYLAPFVLPKAALERLAESTETASPALLRQLCEGLKRQMIIGPKVGWDMAKEAVIERLITAIEPHASLGKPRLWSQGAKDIAVRWLPWPLPWPLPRAGESAASDEAAGGALRVVEPAEAAE
jgi:hypothetical protein